MSMAASTATANGGNNAPDATFASQIPWIVGGVVVVVIFIGGLVWIFKGKKRK